MTPTKLLIGQIAIVFAIMILGVWAATQWAASMLGYQGGLGRPWLIVGGFPLYRPWQLFVWWYEFDAYAPRLFNKAGALAATSGFLGCGAAVVGSLWRARQAGNVTTYGSAHWAETAEIERAGLLGSAGVFLGERDGSYLRHDGPEHVIAFAPTRSGKGVGLVVPTLLGWTGSAVIHDIKGENWQLTAGWRSRFSHCLLFDPTDGRSAKYNPLLEVRRGETEVRDVQNIADILVDPVIATDRRIYHVEAVSTERTAIAALSWSYPGDGLAIARAPAALPPEPVAAGIAVDQLNFDYRIEGDNVSWRPVRAFDDGHQVFIEFPPNIGEGEAPPLFVTGADGKAELTNYRLKGRYYIVDGLFAAAELRLGGKHQKVVRIRNESAGTRQRRPA